MFGQRHVRPPVDFDVNAHVHVDHENEAEQGDGEQRILLLVLGDEHDLTVVVNITVMEPETQNNIRYVSMINPRAQFKFSYDF